MYDILKLLSAFFFRKMIELFRWALGSQLVQLPAWSRTSTELGPAWLGNCPVSLANLWGQRSDSPSGSLFQGLAVFMQKMLFPQVLSRSPWPCSWSSPAGDQCPICIGDQNGAQYSVWCSECQVTGINHFPWPPTYTSGNTAQYTARLPCYFYPIAFWFF